MPRPPKNHGIASTRTQGESEAAPKRETRGSKRKAFQSDEPEENGANGFAGYESSSDDGQPSSAQRDSNSPRKYRKTRAQSSSDEDDNRSLIVKLSLPKSPAAPRTRARTASVEPVTRSRSRPVTKRRRLETPSNVPSPIEDVDDEFEPVDEAILIPGTQINSSTPSSPASVQSAQMYTPPAAQTPINRPKWSEPALIDFNSSLKGLRNGHYAKFEYDMSTDPSVRDDLRAQRHLLSEDARMDDTDTPIFSVPTRGRGGRGRGRGGRGRGRVMNTRDVPEESEIITPSQGRGRAGYRVKKSENPRIQALYHRKADLRHQYRGIANLQRAALEALAEKSLETLKKDPEAHAKLPAFGAVTGKLGQVFDEMTKKANAKLRIHREFLQRKKINEAYYEEIKKDCCADEFEEELASEFYMDIEHTIKQWEMRGEGVPGILRFDDGRYDIKRILKPKKCVAIEATPGFRPGDFLAPVGPHIPTLGDTEFEQHPANFNMLDPQHRESLLEAVRQLRKDNLSKKKSKSAKALLGAAPAAAPLPALAIEAQEIDNDSMMDSDAEPAEGLDKHGVKLPKKQQPKNGAPPNNRFVVERHFDFEEDEIGVRNTKTKRTNTGDAIYMGKDGHANPKNFHFDQRANGYNSGRHKPTELSRKQIGIYGLHPVYGLPIKGSRNMTYEEYETEFGEEAATAVQHVLNPRTNWSEPLAPTRPVVFIEEADLNNIKEDERSKKIFRTSRSEHLIRMEQIIRERPGKDKIEMMLKELWEDYKEARKGALEPEVVEPSPSPEVTPTRTPSPSPPPSHKGKEKAYEIDKASISNLAAAAITVRSEEEARVARPPTVEKRTRLVFDPVRDISPPPPEPEDRTNLNLLANLASSSRSTASHQPAQAPYHSAYPPRASFPPPFTWTVPAHNPVAMAHPHAHPLPPPSAHPLQQQNRPQPGGSLRQLLPAPPQGASPSNTSSSGQIYRY